MKINIFFFSKWKWKADALIQTLYKRPPGRDKRKGILLPSSRALARALLPSSPLFSFATSRPFAYSGTHPTVHPFPCPPPGSGREKKQKRWWDGVPGRKKSSRRYYFIFRPFGPPAVAVDPSTVRPPASQPFIGRLGNLQTLKRTKGNDGFLTPDRTTGVCSSRWGGVEQ